MKIIVVIGWIFLWMRKHNMKKVNQIITVRDKEERFKCRRKQDNPRKIIK